MDRMLLHIRWPRLLLACAPACLLVGQAIFTPILLGQAAVPFAVTPALPAASRASGFTIEFETGAHAYTPLNFNVSSPFGALSSSSAMSAYLSGGSKLFDSLAPAPPGVSIASQIVALGDFTGNGSIEFAYINVYTNTQGVSIYQFDPSLVYENTSFYHVGDYSASVLAADLNGDGKPDLAVSFNGGVGVLLNNGDGTFANSATYASGLIVEGLTAADVNHDGKMDLIAAASDSSSKASLVVLLGKGDGTFAQSNIASSSIVLSVITGDFNGDDNLDLAVTTAAGITIYTGAGNGAFTAGQSYDAGIYPNYLAAGDLNGDGKLDLVVSDTNSDSVVVALGNGDGTFQIASSYATSYRTSPLVLTDYNGDGKLDILCGLGDARAIGPNLDNKSIDILIGNGDGSFAGAPQYSSALTATNVLLTADFDGDGETDAILAGDAQVFLKGVGGGAFAQPVALPLRSNVKGAAVGDFNGDGKPDAAFVDSSGNIDIEVNANGALFASSTLSAGPGGPGVMAAGDFNGDGKIDLAIASNTFGTTAAALTIFTGSGTGSFTQSASYSLSGAANRIIAADLNGDGKPDVIVSDGGFYATGTGTGSVLVYLTTPAGGLASPASYTFSENPTFLTLADVNGDAKPDLVVSTSDNAGNWYIGVALGSGDGIFGATQLVPTDFGVSSIAVSDFDGDGKSDLAVAHCCGATKMSFLHGNGDGTFQPEVLFDGGPSPEYLAAIDLNGDGKLDVLAAGAYGTLVTLLTTGQSSATVVNSASFAANQPIAPDSIATAFGSHLGVSSSNTSNTTVTVTDSAGTNQTTTLFYVSPTQINFAIPAGLATGPATVTVTSSDGVVTSGTVTLAAVAPGIYAANGLALGTIAQADAAGNQTQVNLVNADSAGNLVTTPINLGSSTTTTYLVLYGTGIRGAALSDSSVQIGGMNVTPAYAGATPQFTGEDQINFEIPYSLKGIGDTTITISAGVVTSNAVHVTIQ